MITPSQSVLPEQETSVASQGSKHKQNASYDPGWKFKYFHFILAFEESVSGVVPEHFLGKVNTATI